MQLFTEEDIQEAEEAERQHKLVAQGCIHLPNGKMAVTHEFDSTLYLERLMKSAKRIRFFEGDVCRLVQVRARHRVVRLNRLGLSLLLACKSYRECALVGAGQDERQRYSQHKFHPYLEIALKAIAEVEAAVNDALAFKEQDLLYELIARLATAIHAETNTESFKTSVRNYERNAEAKLRRALNYLLSLFAMRSRLLILRVDLYVRSEGKAWGYTAEADDAFDKFAEALSSSAIVDDVLGWMSAREDGIERGRHYHILAVIDAHEHRAGANLTKMLGEYWVNECVGSDKLGSYFNCFALVDKYQHLGIGTIHCMDAKKLLGLFYATRYLCKDEVQLIATGKGSRNFRRGLEDKSYVRHGAPRSRDDGLALARQVLFGQLRLIKSRSRAATVAATRSDASDPCSLPP